MKTSIDISDSLMRRCKDLAKTEGVTFRVLVEEGLEKVLAERTQRKPFKLRPTPVAGGGFQPGIDESDWDAIRDAAYDRTAE